MRFYKEGVFSGQIAYLCMNNKCQKIVPERETTWLRGWLNSHECNHIFCSKECAEIHRQDQQDRQKYYKEWYSYMEKQQELKEPYIDIEEYIKRKREK